MDQAADPIPPQKSSWRRVFGRKRKKAHWSIRLPYHGLKMMAEIVGGILLVIGIVGGVFVWQLSSGPISYEALTRQIALGLQGRLPAGFSVRISSAQINEFSEGLALSVNGLVIRDEGGRTVIASPQADISFDGLSLLTGQIVPRSIEFVGLSVALVILPDGRVSISTEVPASETGAPSPEQEISTPDLQPTAPTVPLSLVSFVNAISTPVGPLSILERAGVRNGLLRIDDQRRGRVVRYHDLLLSYARPDPAAVDLFVSARGDHGVWTARGTLTGAAGEPRRLAMRTTDLAVSELLGFAEKGVVPFQTDMPLSIDVSVDVAADDTLLSVDGAITGGKAALIFDDPKAPPMQIDAVKGEFRLLQDGSQIAIPAIELVSGASKWSLSGKIDVPKTVNDGWHFAFESNGATQIEAGNLKKPVRVDRFNLEGRVLPGFSGAEIERIDIRGPDLSIAGQARFGSVNAHNGLKMTLTAGRSKAQFLMAFWPVLVVPEVRSYLGTAIEGGMIENFSYTLDLDPAGLAAALAKEVIPDGSVLLTADLSDVTMRVDKDLPPLVDLAGIVTVTGQTVGVELKNGAIAVGGNRVLPVVQGTYRVEDTALVPAVADIVFRIKGGADAFVAGLKSPALRTVSAISLDPSAVKGQVDMQIKLRVPLKPDLLPADVQVDAEGKLSGFSLEKAFGRERLDNSVVAINVDRDGTKLSGEGSVAGAPVRFDIVQPANTPKSTARIKLTVDDAWRAKAGMKTAGMLSGPVTVRLDIPDLGATETAGSAEADFTAASISGLLPGWSKPAGKALKADFKLVMAPKDEILLESLTIEDPSITLKGSVLVAGDGQIKSARLSTLRIAKGDNVSAELERVGAVYRIAVKGEQFDARPLMKSAFSPSTGSPATGQDFDIDLKIASLIGFNSEILKSADIRAQLRGGLVRDLKLAGNLAKQAVAGQMAKGEKGEPVIVLESADAGALLRFTDIYRKMNAGSMMLVLSASGEPLIGKVTIRNFALLEESAIEGALTQPGGGEGTAIVTDPKNVQFNRLKAEFSAASGRVTLKDATMWGTVLGGTLEGTIDYPKDMVDLRGTFVPAYLVNNFFNKIPLLGELLGGANEGVFAVTFSVSGPVAAPSVQFNPLSVAAPGFLRRIFDVIGPIEAPVPPAEIPKQ